MVWTALTNAFWGLKLVYQRSAGSIVKFDLKGINRIATVKWQRHEDEKAQKERKGKRYNGRTEKEHWRGKKMSCVLQGRKKKIGRMFFCISTPRGRIDLFAGWIPCFQAISPGKRTRIRVVEGYKRILERYLCGYLFHGPPDWWFASIQSDTSKIRDERIMNDCSSVGVYVIMRNKFSNEKLFRFASQENYLLNR